MTALGNFGIVGSLMRSFGLARGAGAQIFNLLQNVPTINPLLDRGFKPHTAEGTIELKNVVFQYPSRPDVPVSSYLILNSILVLSSYREGINYIYFAIVGFKRCQFDRETRAVGCTSWTFRIWEVYCNSAYIPIL